MHELVTSAEKKLWLVSATEAAVGFGPWLEIVGHALVLESEHALELA